MLACLAVVLLWGVAPQKQFTATQPARARAKDAPQTKIKKAFTPNVVITRDDATGNLMVVIDIPAALTKLPPPQKVYGDTFEGETYYSSPRTSLFSAHAPKARDTQTKSDVGSFKQGPINDTGWFEYVHSVNTFGTEEVVPSGRRSAMNQPAPKSARQPKDWTLLDQMRTYAAECQQGDYEHAYQLWYFSGGTSAGTWVNPLSLGLTKSRISWFNREYHRLQAVKLRNEIDRGAIARVFDLESELRLGHLDLKEIDMTEGQILALREHYERNNHPIVRP